MDCPNCNGTGEVYPKPYTAEDLDAAVRATYAPTGRWHDEGGWAAIAWNDREHELPGIGTLQRVEYHDEEFETKCWLIVRVTDFDGNVRLFRRNGWRASHDGSYLEGPTEEVEETTETRTVYTTVYKAVE